MEKLNVMHPESRYDGRSKDVARFDLYMKYNDKLTTKQDAHY